MSVTDSLVAMTKNDDDNKAKFENKLVRRSA